MHVPKVLLLDGVGLNTKNEPLDDDMSSSNEFTGMDEKGGSFKQDFINIPEVPSLNIKGINKGNTNAKLPMKVSKQESAGTKIDKTK